MKKFYVPDFLLYGKIVVELKAEKQLCSSDEAQLLNELKATGKDLGLLINFGADSKLDWCRRALTKRKDNSRKLAEISG